MFIQSINDRFCKAKLDNNKIVEFELKFTIGTALQFEEKFGTLSKGLAELKYFKTCIWLLQIMLNEAIKKYNHDYNANVESVETFETDIAGFAEIAKIIEIVQRIVMNDVKTEENVNKKNKKGKKKEKRKGKMTLKQ